MNNFLYSSGIEDLCSKREELNRQIKQEEEEKERLQHDIRVLSEKLSRVNESLAQRLAARATFDRTIAETEAAYTKVCVDCLKYCYCTATLEYVNYGTLFGPFYNQFHNRSVSSSKIKP